MLYEHLCMVHLNTKAFLKHSGPLSSSYPRGVLSEADLFAPILLYYRYSWVHDGSVVRIHYNTEEMRLVGWEGSWRRKPGNNSSILTYKIPWWETKRLQSI